MPTRPSAVAGTWYPGTAGALTRDVDRYLQAAPDWTGGRIRAVLAPHAGLMFSGPVGAHAYKAASSARFDVVVLAGPSHYVAFDGVSIYPEGAFATPLGDAPIDADVAQALMASAVISSLPSAHQREHSLEMQLPFVRRLFPDARIVPLVMGLQTRETIEALAAALASACTSERILLVASTDLSHYFDARTAQELDGRVARHVGAFDAEGLLETFERYPEQERGRFVACGGGPAIAVMMAARLLGATDARVLKYAHSGEVSGDFNGVVGYLAAVFGNFPAAAAGQP
jgi:AmmeMemoRadiSam system protein B